MRASWIASTGMAVLAVLLGTATTPTRAADPASATVASPAADAGIVVSGSGQDMTITAAALALLPMVPVPAGTAPGARERTFEGPLLWTVLAHAGAVDPAKHQADVRGTVLLTGRDGYVAVLALGELSPEFENKAVILAVRADGQPLDPAGIRVVVPGDKRAGRSVRDLARVAVTVLPGKP